MSEQEEKVPTNRELAEQVAKLAAELGVEIKPAGSKAKLLEQLEQLEQQRSGAASPPAPTGGAVRADVERDTSTTAVGDTSPSAESDASLGAGATRPVPPASATGQVSSLDTSGGPPPATAPRAFRVAPGKAITSKRGILGPGELVLPEDIRGDEASVRESLRALERRGLIVRS